MNKLFVPLAFFFGLFSLWLFADNILDSFDPFAKIWWYQYHVLLKITEYIIIKALSLLWGIEAFVFNYRNIALPAGQSVAIWNDNLGLDVYMLFSLFIISWPAKWKTRLWIIPSGIFILFIANITIICLALLKAYHTPPPLPMPDFAKFKTLLYIITVILWIVFIRFFGDRKFLKSIDIGNK